ncbi:MAG: hypothetical protein HYY42_04345 [Chloroflexi bacterium]|nr:hypothetical protein [Chloroflexota bacterium]
MGKGTTRRKPARVASASRRRASDAGATRTRSFPCPDDLWGEIESFAGERGLGSPAAAARLLLRSGLSLERRVRELQAARDWQIEQAWADLQAIAAGDRTFGSWDEIEQAAERARLRVREREAAEQQAGASA